MLDRERPASVQLRWRPIGAGEFRTVDFDHQGRGVYEAALPPLTHWGIEYHVRAQTEAGKTLVWPATAPGLNQTVIQGP